MDRMIAAGPCGTSATATPAGTAFTWTLLMLWPHLAHHYATRKPTDNPHAKAPRHGGGHGKVQVA
jgi:hypothetical protein